MVFVDQSDSGSGLGVAMWLLLVRAIVTLSLFGMTNSEASATFREGKLADCRLALASLQEPTPPSRKEREKIIQRR